MGQQRCSISDARSRAPCRPIPMTSSCSFSRLGARHLTPMTCSRNIRVPRCAANHTRTSMAGGNARYARTSKRETKPTPSIAGKYSFPSPPNQRSREWATSCFPTRPSGIAVAYRCSSARANAISCTSEQSTSRASASSTDILSEAIAVATRPSASISRTPCRPSATQSRSPRSTLPYATRARQARNHAASSASTVAAYGTPRKAASGRPSGWKRSATRISRSSTYATSEDMLQLRVQRGGQHRRCRACALGRRLRRR